VQINILDNNLYLVDCRWGRLQFTVLGKMVNESLFGKFSKDIRSFFFLDGWVPGGTGSHFTSPFS
jgi:hypothetical protein